MTRETFEDDGWQAVEGWITHFWTSLGGAPSTLRDGDAFVAARMVMEMLAQGLIFRDGDVIRAGAGSWEPPSHDHYFIRRVEDAIAYADEVWGRRG